MNKLIAQITENPKIAIPTRKGYIFIKPSEIIRCEANKKHAVCILKNHTREDLSLSLKQTEAMLKEFGFLRVHHAHLININHIEKYEKEKYSSSGGMITMSSGEIVSLSKRKKQAFQKLFKSKFIPESLESILATIGN